MKTEQELLQEYYTEYIKQDYDQIPEFMEAEPELINSVMASMGFRHYAVRTLFTGLVREVDRTIGLSIKLKYLCKIILKVIAVSR